MEVAIHNGRSDIAKVESNVMMFIQQLGGGAISSLFGGIRRRMGNTYYRVPEIRLSDAAKISDDLAKFCDEATGPIDYSTDGMTYLFDDGSNRIPIFHGVDARATDGLYDLMSDLSSRMRNTSSRVMVAAQAVNFDFGSKGSVTRLNTLHDVKKCMGALNNEVAILFASIETNMVASWFIATDLDGNIVMEFDIDRDGFVVLPTVNGV